ncbi:MAG: DUF2344 domain-containing protein [Ruminococcaceae bacterium]|nr:DUF2344 domain-containing protein [Oscillospiraceae bacterium]
MFSIRMFFEKKEPAIYVSHLDLMRCFERCIRRAGIPLWYTEGFNPRPFLTFALPLSLGITGLNESVDLRLVEDMPLAEVQQRINACLPSGLRILSISEPVKKNTDIAASIYDIDLRSGSVNADELAAKLSGFLSQDSIVITKLNKKKKPVESDLRPHIKAFSVSTEDGGVKLCITLSSGCTENCNPALVLDTFASRCEIGDLEYAITRTDVLDTNGKSFR